MKTIEEIINSLPPNLRETVKAGKDILSFPRLSTGSPSLDRVLGGGIPIGVGTTVVGDANSGKTTLCISTAVQCQLSGKKVLWIDTEYKFNMAHAIIMGLNPVMFMIDQGSIESSIDVVVATLSKNPGEFGLVVWDSLAQGLSRKTLEKTAQEGMMASTESLVYSKGWPRVLAAAHQASVAVLATNQWRTKGIGSGIHPWKDQYGGYTIKYSPSVIIGFQKPDPFTRGGITRGQSVPFRIEKSQVSDPYMTGIIQIDYDGETGKYGISKVGELIDLGIEAGIVKKAGSWYSYKDIKSQGYPNFKFDVEEREDIILELENILIHGIVDDNTRSDEIVSSDEG